MFKLLLPGSGSVVNRQDDCMRYFEHDQWHIAASALPATYGNTNNDFPQVRFYASFTVICSTAISNGAGLPKISEWH